MAQARRGRRAESPPKRARKVRLIRETRSMRRIGKAAAGNDLANGTAQALPDPETPERHADVLREEMLKARGRKPHVTCSDRGARRISIVPRERRHNVRNARIHRAPRPRAGKTQQAIESSICPARTVARFIERAQNREFSAAPQQRAPIRAAGTHQRNKRIESRFTRFEIKHRQRLPGDIELVRNASRNDGRTTVLPSPPFDPQPKALVQASQINRHAVRVRSVVGERPDEQRAARIEMPDRQQFLVPGQTRSTFVQVHPPPRR